MENEKTTQKTEVQEKATSGTELLKAISANDLPKVAAALEESGLSKTEAPVPTPGLVEFTSGILTFATAVAYRGDMSEALVRELMDRTAGMIDIGGFLSIVSYSLKAPAIKDCEALSVKTRIGLLGFRGETDMAYKLVWKLPLMEALGIVLAGGMHIDFDEKVISELYEAKILPPHMLFTFMATSVCEPELPNPPMPDAIAVLCTGETAGIDPKVLAQIIANAPFMGDVGAVRVVEMRGTARNDGNPPPPDAENSGAEGNSAEQKPESSESVSENAGAAADSEAASESESKDSGSPNSETADRGPDTKSASHTSLHAGAFGRR